MKMSNMRRKRHALRSKFASAFAHFDGLGENLRGVKGPKPEPRDERRSGATQANGNFQSPWDIRLKLLRSKNRHGKPTGPEPSLAKMFPTAF